MRVKAWLTGHELDLAFLAHLIPSGEVRVTKDDKGYFLSAAELDTLQEDALLYERAARLLAMANGWARVSDQGFRPVSFSGTYTFGDQIHSVGIADTIRIRAHIEASGIVTGAVGPGRPAMSTPEPERLLPTINPNIAEALAIMGQPLLGWAELYKAFEIVRDDAGVRTITRLGWATQAEIDAFTASANRPDVSGAAARHARMSGRPPRRRMTEAEARSFIARILIAWVDEKR